MCMGTHRESRCRDIWWLLASDQKPYNSNAALAPKETVLVNVILKLLTEVKGSRKPKRLCEPKGSGMHMADSFPFPECLLA